MKKTFEEFNVYSKEELEHITRNLNVRRNINIETNFYENKKEHS